MRKQKDTITIYDVAREAGVSMATVSRVVNGNPNVKPTTRKKVLAVIRQLGYRPNAVARGLASKRTTTVGVVVPDISKAFYAELTRGMEDIATMYHYNMILSNSDMQQDRERMQIETLLEKQVDGLIFLGGEITAAHREMLNSASVPVVLAYTYDEENQLPFVTINQREAASQATRVLCQEGHEIVAMISGPVEDRNNGQPRLEGYRQVLKEWNLPYDESWVKIGDYRYRSGYKAMQAIMSELPDCRAVFAASDEMAVGAIHAVIDAGRRVPEEFSIIGFDDIPLAEQVRPLLSTVHVPMYDIGAVSMRLLTKYMNQETVEQSQVLLETQVQLRQTTRLTEEELNA